MSVFAITVDFENIETDLIGYEKGTGNVLCIRKCEEEDDPARSAESVRRATPVCALIP